ncbi:NAD-dependent dehydratase [Candidatus Daviesbacteria bacterium RIFCSPHIGHO2_01_FULL_44_29]|uniref:NAD-dependent dehydratase n=1 Tax=Candidatus Daviesbacteria bacterium RIFCSPHIGHO2_02_FULL_43_12 TaxID=1797776 RepID=A0A1F5KKB1_9BACT|nr:MAG: NAD-dependent dehydratase [Candidatus Daviesbacteria bacterium RIFCSPHIGHO2_01_FULL_44_29]OGE40616.1 MAG: NAD-dependent dehydratase [Candidatus Daviesbacteria bacterium RIFCSPHIGHO2_12_FULL_47_45]OGE41269.1 MAG: NAD-dependent dehydratase [Candidatus Daviesbacteria bacterium RIFCSPHIGHO2_02_FULL_43_12]OGE69470.1 MAG: NAD-dependent dehydratase [Candidatus Daviesbacteria bacterium RIFCSPLOWO2_01_FULL_43_15]
MKILVAGGAGFLGSHLCERFLKESHEVICVDNLLTGSKENIQQFLGNPKFAFLEHDVTKPIPENITAEAVFHFASPASPNHHSSLSYHALPMETMLVNTQGTLELLKFAEKNKAKFLFASTSECYGDPLEAPQKEEYRGNVSTTGPRSVYDEAKRFGETITAYFERDRGVDARIVRIFNTYGPRMQKADMRMIITFINQALENKPVTIFGDGQQTRSLCYVDDTVEGIYKLMFSPNTKGEVVNIGNPEEHTVVEYAEMVKRLTNSKSEIIFSEDLPEDDPKKRQPDITKARKLLGWEPKVDLKEGLLKMIEWVRS